MASWQAHALSFFLRWRFKRQLAAAQDVTQVRQVMNQMPPGQPRGVQCSAWTGAGVEGERVVQLNTIATAPLLYLHGGGFVAGSFMTHRAITAAFARRGFEVFVPNYRLAPEHPFPAAVDDALAAYQAVLALRPGVPLVIAGDSAGGATGQRCTCPFVVFAWWRFCRRLALDPPRYHRGVCAAWV